MAPISVEQIAARVQAGLVVGKRPVRRTNMKISGVYAIFNVVSGRLYVGSSYTIGLRWSSHIHQLERGTHHALALQRSWNKHGEAAFSWEILEHVVSHDALFVREQFWINALGAFHPTAGFNGYPQAGGPRGHKASQKTRDRMSETRKGRKMPPRSDEHRAAIGAGRKGKKYPALSKAKTGIIATPQARAKMSAARKGTKAKPFTDKHKAAISAAASRRIVSEDKKQFLRTYWKGRQKSQEHLKNIKAAWERKKVPAAQLPLPI
jgi:group I intron endonuclease